jgi:hypothetical protein
MSKYAICRYFASSRNLWQTILPPLHGGERFDFPGLHVNEDGHDTSTVVQVLAKAFYFTETAARHYEPP